MNRNENHWFVTITDLQNDPLRFEPCLVTVLAQIVNKETTSTGFTLALLDSSEPDEPLRASISDTLPSLSACKVLGELDGKEEEKKEIQDVWYRFIGRLRVKKQKDTRLTLSLSVERIEAVKDVKKETAYHMAQIQFWNEKYGLRKKTVHLKPDSSCSSDTIIAFMQTCLNEIGYSVEEIFSFLLMNPSKDSNVVPTLTDVEKVLATLDADGTVFQTIDDRHYLLTL